MTQPRVVHVLKSSQNRTPTTTGAASLTSPALAVITYLPAGAVKAPFPSIFPPLADHFTWLFMSWPRWSMTRAVNWTGNPAGTSTRRGITRTYAGVGGPFFSGSRARVIDRMVVLRVRTFGPAVPRW